MRAYGVYTEGGSSPRNFPRLNPFTTEKTKRPLPLLYPKEYRTDKRFSVSSTEGLTQYASALFVLEEKHVRRDVKKDKAAYRAAPGG